MEKIVLENLANIAQWQDRLQWQPFREGVEIYGLYGDRTQGPSAALLRYQPGAAVPTHTHQGFEHIFVLSGSQSDPSGSYDTGTFVINPPQSHHSVQSDAGCIVLIIWEKPVELWS
jgi:anti-sigma factor ChrR (cupin superfamily)